MADYLNIRVDQKPIGQAIALIPPLCGLKSSHFHCQLNGNGGEFVSFFVTFRLLRWAQAGQPAEIVIFSRTAAESGMQSTGGNKKYLPGVGLSFLFLFFLFFYFHFLSIYFYF